MERLTHESGDGRKFYIVKGDKGAVTGYPSYWVSTIHRMLLGDISMHSHKPLYDWQGGPIDCEWIGKCYCDGRSTGMLDGMTDDERFLTLEAIYKERLT